jgi:hypothetical protein
MSFRAPSLRCLSVIALSLLTCSLTGCYLRRSMQVQYGTQPEHVDSHVAFRTTYYFRVFGGCTSPMGTNNPLPEYSGLYRFRMTGKANRLTNKVKFESGVLPAESIDPFGASLRYDEETDSLLFRNQDAESRAKAVELFTGLAERLDTLSKKLDATASDASMESSAAPSPPSAPAGETASPATSATADAARQELKGIISNLLTEIRRLTTNRVAADYQLELTQIESAYESLQNLHEKMKGQLSDAELKEARELAKKQLAEAMAEVVGLVRNIARGKSCSGNDRGFLILGPEGWKQFNPNDRLIMAMYSSGRPLIATLNELSARANQAKGPSAEASLVYANHDAQIISSLAKLNEFETENPQSAIKALEDAAAELNKAK